MRLLVGGLPAPLLSVSSNKIIAIMPLGLAESGPVAVEVDRSGGAVAYTQVPLAAANPAIFGAGTTDFISSAVFNEDFSLNSATNPAGSGDIVTVFVSGGGALTPAPPDGAIIAPDSLPLAAVPITAFILGAGGQAVTFAGQAANAAAGLLQVNVRIAPDFPYHGQMGLGVFFGGKQAEATFWIR